MPTRLRFPNGSIADVYFTFCHLKTTSIMIVCKIYLPLLVFCNCSDFAEQGHNVTLPLPHRRHDNVL